MDDFLFGGDDLSSARRCRDELIALLKVGGFRLHKWASNHEALLADIPTDDRLRPEWRDFEGQGPVKTLGIT